MICVDFILFFFFFTSEGFNFFHFIFSDISLPDFSRYCQVHLCLKCHWDASFSSFPCSVTQILYKKGSKLIHKYIEERNAYNTNKSLACNNQLVYIMSYLLMSTKRTHSRALISLKYSFMTLGSIVSWASAQYLLIKCYFKKNFFFFFC